MVLFVSVSNEKWVKLALEKECLRAREASCHLGLGSPLPLILRTPGTWPAASLHPPCLPPGVLPPHGFLGTWGMFLTTYHILFSHTPSLPFGCFLLLGTIYHGKLADWKSGQMWMELGRSAFKCSSSQSPSLDDVSYFSRLKSQRPSPP